MHVRSKIPPFLYSSSVLRVSGFSRVIYSVCTLEDNIYFTSICLNGLVIFLNSGLYLCESHAVFLIMACANILIRAI